MDQYFATLPTEELGGELNNRVSDYYQKLQINRHLSKIRKSYQLYYGLGRDDSSMIHALGEQGEILGLKLNHHRSILNHILVLTTQNRAALKCVAVNSDYASQSSARLGDSLLDYYFKTRNLEKVLKEATELALITGKGYAVMKWDTNQGEEYGVNPETSAVIYDGDVSITAKSCLEVIQDIYEENPSWYIIRELKNKHDLAAQYPELAESITERSMDKGSEYRIDFYSSSQDDIIPVYTFIHKRTPAVPNGRLVEFLEGDTVLTDGPLPYREPLVYPITPSRIQGTQLGYTPGFDMVAVNDSLNELASAVLTNQSTFGTQNIWTKTGSNLSVQQIEGGMNLIESDAKPEPLNLVQTPPELFKFFELLQGQMETLSGINAVLRGQPQPSLQSGSALALVAAQALQYNSGLQHSYADLLTAVGNGIIHLLQDYASTPKVAAIVGIANKSMLTAFTGDSLKQIDRVIVEQVNAVSKTTAGRMELANNLLTSGLLTRPGQYLEVIETGTLQPILETEVTESMLIQQENEALRSGQPVLTMITDIHGEHIRGHKEVLADPEARKDPALVQAVTEHIQEHLNLARSSDPFLLAILKKQDMPPPPVPQGPPGTMGPPPGPSDQPQMPQLPSLPQEAPPSTQDSYQQALPQGA